MTSTNIRRHTRTLLIGGVLLVMLLGACSSSSKSSTSSTTPTSATSSPTTAPSTTTTTVTAASKLLGQAVQNAQAKAWAHIHVVTTDQGQTATIDEEAGPSIGRQTITLGAAHGVTELVGGVAYFQGNVGAVTAFFGLTGTKASALANKWISIQPADAAFTAASADTTLGDVLKELALVPPLTLGVPANLNGQQLIGIGGHIQSAGTGTGTGTVYVTTGSTPLPAVFRGSTSAGTISATFSNWGQAVSLPAPTGAVTFASLGLPTPTG